MEQSGAAPRFVFIEAVERVARGHTGFAAAATVEIHFKGVLFARFRCGQRHQDAVRRSGQFTSRMGIVPARETFDRCEVALLFQQRVDQRARFSTRLDRQNHPWVLLKTL